MKSGLFVVAVQLHPPAAVTSKLELPPAAANEIVVEEIEVGHPAVIEKFELEMSKKMFDSASTFILAEEVGVLGTLNE